MRLLLNSALSVICLTSLGFAAGQIQPSAFHIAIIDGEGALNNVKGRLAREPIIQVEDENHKPVVGAYVAFDAPANGPGAVFAGGSSHFVTTTDSLGHAVAHGLRPNNVTGNFEIQVHVTYQGQPIGNVTIHQVNVSGPVANLSKNLQTSAAVAATVAAGVLGVIVGQDFLVNGNALPGNANLTGGAKIQTLGATVKLFLHDQCEFLVAPHSTMTVESGQIALQTGTLRAQRFGNCSISHAGLEVLGAHETSDGVVGVSAEGFQVASIGGGVRVLTADGAILGTVEPGTLSTFGTAAGGGASGASAAPQLTSRRRLTPYYLTLGATATGLGIAIDAVSQPSPTPTSP